MISQITKLQKGQVKFHGIIETIRDKKSMQFVILKDFSGKIQLFIDKIKFPEVGEVFSKLIPGATVIVEGELIENDSVKLGGKEVQVNKVEVTSYAEANPIEGKISNDSPIAKGIIGKKLNEEVVIPTPGGEMKIRIIDIQSA